MRWIFVALILINGCYFGWEFWQRSQEAVSQAGERQAPEQPADESLVLLTERLPSSESAAPPPPLPSSSLRFSADTSSEVSRKTCTSVGPFSTRASAMDILSLLDSAGTAGQIRETQASSGSRHWVVIPPQESRERALQLLRELQARKIDSFIVSSGTMKNAISLGVFAREELATDFREKIRAIGYPAQSQLKDPAKAEFWIHISSGQLVESTKKVIESRLTQEAPAKISDTACETFAQSR